MPQNTILITGASAGIGEACARAFTKEGAKLILHGRRKERLDALAKELKVPCHVITADVRDHMAITQAIESLPKDFANVDVLINNAGLALGLEPADQASLEEWEIMVDTNIKGVLYVTKAVLPGMIARDRGHIINLGSIAGTYPYPGGNVYGATKAFLKQFSLNLRADLLGKNIRVTNIEPGMVETEFSIVRFHGDKARADQIYAGMDPLVASDIADAILWCATRPEHVNINSLELMPVRQAAGGPITKRKE